MTIATPIADSFSDYVAPAEIRQGIYTDSSVFRAELERIFYRTWIYLGHECQLDAPGSFFLGHIGLTSVVVVRDRDNAIHVLENRCSHRGPPVCRELHGRANVLTCPYHGWSFKLNGDLLRVPFDSDYTERFCRERRGLRRVPRVDSYRGFIFASMAEGGPNLETFLGIARSALDDFMDRAPEGVVDLVDHTPLRHRYRGNWKIQFENLGDFIHPLFAHGSAMNASLNVQNAGNDSQDGIVDLIAGFNTFVGKISDLNYQITEYGHSFAPGVAKLSGVLQDSDRRLAEVLARTRGEEEGRRIVDVDNWVTMIYPSLIIKPNNQNLRIIRPLSVGETEITMHQFKMRGAPDKVGNEAYDYFRLLGSPASPILADDLAIYEMVQTDYGRQYTLSMERGYGASLTDDGLRPRVSGTSEEYIRNQYRVWESYMNGDLV